MPTTQERLDAGMPVPSGQDPAEAHAEALAYGRAYMAVTNALFGSFLRRLPVVDTGVRVEANQAIVGPGAVLAVQSTGGEDGGEPLRLVLTRPPRTGEVRVEPQADGTQRLTFYPSDAIETVAVYGLWVPAEMIAALDSTP